MVLGLAGSPRRQGNTALLLGEALRGAMSCGAQAETVFVPGLQVSACRHCDACLNHGECAIDDEMETIYRKLAQADAVVLATPLHFMAVTAQIKLVIDRCQSLWARKYVLKWPPLGEEKERRGVFISVGGQKGDSIFDGARLTVKTLFISLNIQYWAELLYAGIDGPGAITRHPTAMQDAFRTGTMLAKK